MCIRQYVLTLILSIIYVKDRLVEMDILFFVDCFIALIFTFFHLLEAIYNEILKIPYKNLENKRVLITGAGRGLGKEIAHQLSKEGCTLILTDINEEGVIETAKEINDSIGSNVAIAYKTDVTNKNDIKKLHENVRNIGHLDILINNAGIVASNGVLEHTDDQINKIIEVNVTANISMVKQFLPDMLKNNSGHIVSIASIAAFTAAINSTPYFASKYAITGFMKCLREELRTRKDNRIVTTTIHPSFLDSGNPDVNHWKVKSRLGNLQIPEVASAVIEGIKTEKATVVVPSYLYYMMTTVGFLPMKAIDLWRDVYKTDIDNSVTNKYAD